MKTTARDEGEGNLTRCAIHWLARLPFLGADDMSSLLGINVNSAGRVLTDFEKLGWVDWVVPNSPELEPRRLYLLTDAARPELPAALGVAEDELSAWYPVGRREALARLARLETTVGLNRFFVELAEALASDIEVDLADARSLPWALRGKARRWPPEVEGYACLRWGPWFAPFFVAWDRAGAPSRHRRKRVAGWYAYRDSENPWGADGLSHILLVCPREREAQQWSRSVLASADRRGCAPLSAATARAGAALADPLGAIWRRVDGIRGAHLCERLRWVPRRSLAIAVPAAGCGDVQLPETPAEAPPLREWARESAANAQNMNSLKEAERLAALSLATSADHKTLLAWVGHHPLLSAADLAALLGLSQRLAQRFVERLGDWALIDAVFGAGYGDSPAPPRYFLTKLGLGLLAARDGVPAYRYARHGVIAARWEGRGKGGNRLARLLHHFEHTVGGNGFFVRLAEDARKGRMRLVRWVNESECAERFSYGGQTRWLRPDGYCEVEQDGEVHRFFLEWDRGTTRPREMTDKFQSYAMYFAALRRRGTELHATPRVLVVTVSPQREDAIWEILRASFAEVGVTPNSFLTSVDSLVGRVGPFAPAWRLCGGSDRVPWPDDRAAQPNQSDPLEGGSTKASLQ